MLCTKIECAEGLSIRLKCFDLGREITSMHLLGNQPREGLLENLEELLSAERVEILGEAAAAGKSGARAGAGAGA